MDVTIPAFKVLRILGLANEAQEIGNREAGLQHALDGLCKLLGADNSFLLAFDSPTASIAQSSVVHGFDGEKISTVLARYFSEGDRFDLLARELRACYDGSAPVLARRRQSLIGDGDWYNSVYFNEYRRPWRFDHSIYSIHSLGAQRVGMSLNRAFGATPFSVEDEALVEIFHLAMGRILSTPASHAMLNHRLRSALAPRARQVLDLLLLGASNKDVAEQLGISPNTVHHYCKMVFRAFDVGSRSELIARWYCADPA
jgi:DNA-binding CsgD family transcriptional regulator